MAKLTLAATVLCIYAGSAACLLAGSLTSFYSSTDPKHVAVIASSHLEKDPEIDHSTHQCPGYAGYELIHNGGDLRSWIDIKKNGKVTDLRQETFDEAPGNFPHNANDVVEWRGRIINDSFVPHAIIYRLADQDEETMRDKTVLVVISLQGKTIRVIGSVSGKNEGKLAQELADSLLRD